MPHVNVKLAGSDTTVEQKKALIEKITDVVSNVMNKNPAATHVVIEELPTDNWGIGGETLTERRKKNL